ncbi:LuxR family transcriptional regulator, maltose regulon positive regulatory protein [Pasteurella testudinis DSM 23072]|uniref:HTH-type transcriptional regulator MalT n=1 Tax=Pasteurella testudinis DSM 23072 TaxID=1122938 RepID=A0A1W1UGT6_9PAST|nr:HTH-type transcriptional regulator MalT [Pasteurella testudinis]SMB80249.1 LuxR family transcriptional regulator, maltose regulon positive regulatory protein [Pasteurella testudinis DSM 23072]SUB50565.1 nitrate/nitrite response regulator protein [Pasteurella testudinis]
MLIPSKLSHSSRLQHIVVRSRLLTLLEKACHYPLVLINAPAGYGKTTLLSQWAETQQNIGWYALDESDNESERFIAYFRAALARATHQESSTAANQAQTNFLAALSQLLVESNQFKPHFFVVIDDYHLIDNNEIHEGLKFWIKHQPQNMTLILISRAMPPLNIANLRVQELLLELDITQLPFTHEESRQFFLDRGEESLSQHEVNQLCDQVEGWPTALQLVNLYARQHNTSLHEAAKSITKINSNHISEYLNDEVFHNLDADTRLFLLRCSLLRSMNEFLVEKITGLSDSRQRLDQLVKQGLFVYPINIDQQEQWWRFHPLFASFLEHFRELELQNELQHLHQQAADAWLEIGYSTEALYHAMQLQQQDTLLAMLQQIGWQLYHQGELKLLEESLSAVQLQQLATYPRLVLLKAWLLQSQHKHHEVGGLLKKFAVAVQQQQIAVDLPLQAEFDALRAQVAINAGDDHTALQLATTALQHLPQEKQYAHIVATAVIGEAQHCRGQLNQALKMMREAEKLAQQNQAYHHILWSLLQQAEILLAQGFLQTAYDILDKATLLVKKQHLQKLPMYEFLLRLKGHILWEWYSLDKAEAMAEAGLQVLADEADKLQCLSLLAKISITRGNLDNAERILRRQRSLLQTHHYHNDWLSHHNEAELLYWQMKDEVQQTRSWLLQSDKPAQDTNHFSHRQWRNIVRANIILQQYQDALLLSEKLISTARTYNFISELNKDLVLHNRICFLQGNFAEAQKSLLEALEISKQTNFISIFVIEGEIMAQQLRQLLQLNILDELLTHKAQFILRSINQHYRHKFAHFDETFVEKLLQNPQVPELLRISPLTQREWQVLGLIYSGYSNEQISTELQVAPTTIKTHIRNLYQKIGVNNRAESIEYTRHLLTLMGYSN